MKVEIPMVACDLDSSMTDWVIEYPKLLRHFEKLGIDYCCGGKSLEAACREQELDPQTVLAELHRVLNSSCSVPQIRNSK